jgi:hypothetical protein
VKHKHGKLEEIFNVTPKERDMATWEQHTNKNDVLFEIV